MPNYAAAHNDLANALKGKGDFDGAIAESREAVRLFPKSARFNFILGDGSAARQRWDESAVYLRRAVQADSGNARYRAELAQALVETALILDHCNNVPGAIVK